MHGSWPSQLITQDVCWLIISTPTDTKLSHRTAGTLPSCPLSLEYILTLLCTHQWRLQHQTTRSSTPADQNNNAKTTTQHDERMGSANTNTKQSALHGSWPSQLITQDVCWLILAVITFWHLPEGHVRCSLRMSLTCCHKTDTNLCSANTNTISLQCMAHGHLS